MAHHHSTQEHLVVTESARNQLLKLADEPEHGHIDHTVVEGLARVERVPWGLTALPGPSMVGREQFMMVQLDHHWVLMGLDEYAAIREQFLGFAYRVDHDLAIAIGTRLGGNHEGGEASGDSHGTEELKAEAENHGPGGFKLPISISVYLRL